MPHNEMQEKYRKKVLLFLCLKEKERLLRTLYFTFIIPQKVDILNPLLYTNSKKVRRVFMKKRIIPLILSMIIFAVVFTGCDENTAGDRKSVSDSAVAGEEKIKQNVGAVNAEYPYANSTNFYAEREDLDDNGIVDGFEQYTLDGRKKKTFQPKGFGELIWVDDEGVYFTVKDKEKDTLCCYPLRKGKDGLDELDEKNLEEILYFGDVGEIFVTPEYIVYSDAAEEAVVRYDRETFETEILYCSPVSEGEVLLEGIIGKKAAVYDCEKDLLVIVDIVSGKMEKLAAVDYDFDSIVAENRYFICWEASDNCVVYDSVTGKIETIISKKEWKRTLTEQEVAGSKKEIDWDLSYFRNLFYDNGRAYISTELGVNNGSVYEKKTLVLSVDITGKGGVAYEKKMTEALHSHCDVRKGKYPIKEQVKVWDSGCFALIKGKMFCYFRKKGGRTDIGQEYNEGMYDIATGKFTELTDKDAEFYYPLYVIPTFSLEVMRGVSESGEFKNTEWEDGDF